MNRPRLSCFLLGILLTASVSAAGADEPTKGPLAGKALAAQLRAMRPESSFTNAGTLHIRRSRKLKWDVSYICRVVVTETNWTSFYAAMRGTNALPGFSVTHRDGAPNIFRDDAGHVLGSSQIDQPFAESDFWLSDLGLEFFSWPDQNVVKWEMKRSFGCRVLESRNPHPESGGYSRVLSWIHEDTGALIQAEGYDVRGKLLKEFRPTETEKVNGRRELKEMTIENAQTDSATRLEFDL